jgi:hypothetical protein
VHVETDMRVTGPAAQFGRGVMQDVSAKLMGRFADCLAEEIAGAAATGVAAGEGGDGGRPEPPPGPAGDSAEAEAAARTARPRPSEEVLDLGEASREAVLKRVAPVAAAMGALILVLGIRRWRR